MSNILLTLSSVFYWVLCVFSMVTGLIYISGKKQLNPLELSDKFVAKLDTEEKMKNFAIKMGYVTFVVGIVQGITAYAIMFGKNALSYWIALGFTVFSIGSVSVKLKGKVNAFPIMKAFFYVGILIVLIIYRKAFF